MEQILLFDKYIQLVLQYIWCIWTVQYLWILQWKDHVCLPGMFTECWRAEFLIYIIWHFETKQQTGRPERKVHLYL